MKEFYRKVLVKKRKPTIMMQRMFVIYSTGKLDTAFYGWKHKAKGIKSFYDTRIDSSWYEVKPLYWLEEIDLIVQP